MEKIVLECKCGATETIELTNFMPNAFRCMNCGAVVSVADATRLKGSTPEDLTDAVPTGEDSAEGED